MHFFMYPCLRQQKLYVGEESDLCIELTFFQDKKMVSLSDIKTIELYRLQISSLLDRRFCVYIVYHPSCGAKLSGTEPDFYSDLDILFTEASISTLPVILLSDFNIHYNNNYKSAKLC